MIEVFKTNVTEWQDAEMLIARIRAGDKNYLVNFDLDDCDKILRVESMTQFNAETIIQLMDGFGFRAEILEDTLIYEINNTQMKIEDYILRNDIHTFFVQADSFPEGVAEAHRKLQTLLPTNVKRNFFGISCPNKQGEIVYLAAVEEAFKGEAEKFKCKTLILKSGNYISVFLPDYEKNIQNISATFMKLLKDPRIDQEGYCVEMYLGEKDMRCAVRLKE